MDVRDVLDSFGGHSSKRNHPRTDLITKPPKKLHLVQDKQRPNAKLPQEENNWINDLFNELNEVNTKPQSSKGTKKKLCLEPDLLIRLEELHTIIGSTIEKIKGGNNIIEVEPSEESVSVSEEFYCGQNAAVNKQDTGNPAKRIINPLQNKSNFGMIDDHKSCICDGGSRERARKSDNVARLNLASYLMEGHTNGTHEIDIQQCGDFRQLESRNAMVPKRRSSCLDISKSFKQNRNICIINHSVNSPHESIRIEVKDNECNRPQSCPKYLPSNSTIDENGFGDEKPLSSVSSTVVKDMLARCMNDLKKIHKYFALKELEENKCCGDETCKKCGKAKKVQEEEEEVPPEIIAEEPEMRSNKSQHSQGSKRSPPKKKERDLDQESKLVISIKGTDEEKDVKIIIRQCLDCKRAITQYNDNRNINVTDPISTSIHDLLSILNENKSNRRKGEDQKNLDVYNVSTPCNSKRNLDDCEVKLEDDGHICLLTNEGQEFFISLDENSNQLPERLPVKCLKKVAFPEKQRKCRPFLKSHVCSSLNFNVTTADTKLRYKGIDHPKPSIVVQLREIGVNNLLLASKPAKCCRKAILNERMKRSMPYAASLKSLPLDEKDIRMIQQAVKNKIKNTNGPIQHNGEAENTYHVYYLFIQSTSHKGGDKDISVEKINEINKLSYYVHLVDDIKYDSKKEFTVMHFSTDIKNIKDFFNYFIYLDDIHYHDNRYNVLYFINFNDNKAKKPVKNQDKPKNKSNDSKIPVLATRNDNLRGQRRKSLEINRNKNSNLKSPTLSLSKRSIVSPRVTKLISNETCKAGSAKKDYLRDVTTNVNSKIKVTKPLTTNIQVRSVKGGKKENMKDDNLNVTKINKNLSNVNNQRSDKKDSCLLSSSTERKYIIPANSVKFRTNSPESKSELCKISPEDSSICNSNLETMKEYDIATTQLQKFKSYFNVDSNDNFKTKHSPTKGSKDDEHISNRSEISNISLNSRTSFRKRKKKRQYMCSRSRSAQGIDCSTASATSVETVQEVKKKTDESALFKDNGREFIMNFLKEFSGRIKQNFKNCESSTTSFPAIKEMKQLSTNNVLKQTTKTQLSKSDIKTIEDMLLKFLKNFGEQVHEDSAFHTMNKLVNSFVKKRRNFKDISSPKVSQPNVDAYIEDEERNFIQIQQPLMKTIQTDPSIFQRTISLQVLLFDGICENYSFQVCPKQISGIASKDKNESMVNDKSVLSYYNFKISEEILPPMADTIWEYGESYTGCESTSISQVTLNESNKIVKSRESTNCSCRTNQEFIVFCNSDPPSYLKSKRSNNSAATSSINNLPRLANYTFLKQNKSSIVSMEGELLCQKCGHFKSPLEAASMTKLCTCENEIPLNNQTQIVMTVSNPPKQTSSLSDSGLYTINYANRGNTGAQQNKGRELKAIEPPPNRESEGKASETLPSNKQDHETQIQSPQNKTGNTKSDQPTQSDETEQTEKIPDHCKSEKEVQKTDKTEIRFKTCPPTRHKEIQCSCPKIKLPCEYCSNAYTKQRKDACKKARCYDNIMKLCLLPTISVIKKLTGVDKDPADKLCPHCKGKVDEAKASDEDSLRNLKSCPDETPCRKGSETDSSKRRRHTCSNVDCKKKKTEDSSKKRHKSHHCDQPQAYASNVIVNRREINGGKQDVYDLDSIIRELDNFKEKCSSEKLNKQLLKDLRNANCRDVLYLTEKNLDGTKSENTFYAVTKVNVIKESDEVKIVAVEPVFRKLLQCGIERNVVKSK